jgi:hypothetical protein
MRDADRTRATADLHRWRKAVKHLWHLISMAEAIVPRRLGRLADPLDRLAEILGLDHDHAMLAERVALAPDAGPVSDQLAIIGDRRRGLADEAFADGAELYGAKPREFAKRNRLRAS